jgi:hypothetical protein
VDQRTINTPVLGRGTFGYCGSRQRKCSNKRLTVDFRPVTRCAVELRMDAVVQLGFTAVLRLCVFSHPLRNARIPGTVGETAILNTRLPHLFFHFLSTRCPHAVA